MATPRERELDGVVLDTFKPGSVRDVSPSLAAWLIAQGYAQSEMRSQSTDGQREAAFINRRDVAHERRQKPR